MIGKGAGAEIAEALAAAARGARSRRLADRRRHLFAQCSSRTPDNVDALGGLADLLFEAGDARGGAACSAGVPEDKQDAPAVAAVRAKIELAEEAAALGNPAELEAPAGEQSERSSRRASTLP